MNVVVVGLGLIGGSLGLALKESGFSTKVTGVDNNSSHVRTALERGLVDSATTLEATLPDASLVILAVPMSAMKSLLPMILDELPENATLTDMGSTKVEIVATVQKHPRRQQYVPSHPMAGTENAGPAAAVHGLFKGKTAVICDPAESGIENINRVRSLYHALDMRVIEMTSRDHDLHAAFVSHLSHISSFVLAQTVLEKEKNAKPIFDLAGGGFESTVRLAKSSPEMWAPIFEQNQGNILAALDSYIDHLHVFRDAIAKNDWDRCRELMKQANEIRRVLHKESKNG